MKTPPNQLDGKSLTISSSSTNYFDFQANEYAVDSDSLVRFIRTVLGFPVGSS